jgi:hypothetical protein
MHHHHHHHDEAKGGKATYANKEEDSRDVRREAKLEARERAEGGRMEMETDGVPVGTEEPSGTETELERQRALDTIRARLLLEKQRRIQERQQAAIQAGILPQPSEWTREQMQQKQREYEMVDAEVDAEAQKEFAAMSVEAQTQLLAAARR